VGNVSYLSIIIWLALSTASHAESLCPAKYSTEQINLIKNLATIGAAGEFCPNLKRDIEPLLGYLALAWNGFRLSEMECKLWGKVYDDAEQRAGHQIATNGLKSFCETTIRLYGPNGSLVKNALTFGTESP